MKTVKTTKALRTEELTGAALDWAVAQCEYDNRRYNYGSPCFSPTTKRVYETKGLQEIGVNFAPSEEWKQGGPIIEREKVSIQWAMGCWAAVPDRTNYSNCDAPYFYGPTPLIAAMRCYVASKMGDTIEVPEELTQ